jgi:hypothetical protein
MGPFEPASPSILKPEQDWKVETVYEVDRRIPLQSPDYAVINGKMILQIPPDGNRGAGSLYSKLQVQIGACYAEFEICDLVIDAKISADGSMKLRNAVQTRQLLKLEGDRARGSRRPGDRRVHSLSA